MWCGVVVLALLRPICLCADATWVYAVQISATVRTLPPQIALRWQPDEFGASSYTVYRKLKYADSWGPGVSLPGSATGYDDDNVAVGDAYEYQVVKRGNLGYTGYGYIYAGIETPLTENRGKVILVVESSQAASLANELGLLQQDLVGDGWSVVRTEVSSSDPPAAVRSAIQAIYSADPPNTRALLLFGHIPVFRCGSINVDDHGPRAWPADTFYGDMDGVWSNPNTIPSDVELMAGRVDMANMPVAGSSETELLRNYLNKDHNWRHARIPVERRALIGNRIGDMNGEAPAATGFRNFEPLVGPGNTLLASEQDRAPDAQRWGSLLAAGSFLWADACAAGNYTLLSYMGVHGTSKELWSSDIIQTDSKAVFFITYASWMGDWDSQDDFMRATLATPTMGLTCCLAGRPHWYFHHMGLGEPIGYSARVTQNNNSLYTNHVNRLQRGVHIALMGDPTLRMHPVAPPADLSADPLPGAVRLSWTPSPDSVVGYHVYRATSGFGPFSRRTGVTLNTNAFTDVTPGTDVFMYMVRAVKLESTASGSYYNPSQGAFSAPIATIPIPPPAVAISFRGRKFLQVTWTSTPNLRYTIQCATSLVTPDWRDLVTLTATNATTIWSEPMPADAQRYYRLVAQ
jgi:hypothetical protein